MFLTNLVLIALLVVYSARVTNNDYRYEILKEDYTRLIQQVERTQDTKLGRVQEQLHSIQFTMDRRFELIDDRKFLEQKMHRTQ